MLENLFPSERAEYRNLSNKYSYTKFYIHGSFVIIQLVHIVLHGVKHERCKRVIENNITNISTH